ncbi:helix-turn-helix domain-containing protein [Asticcacaulis sp. W401b]|uniref:helix-turn-helix domain-containing protein n=1 Tax=Asticcacaulis sp. W401b TaxID=3388666 RepID=UPI0039711290
MDVSIGAQIRSIRKAVGVGPSELAEVIGISPQQLQKYEDGSNRITANRLYAVASFLKVPMSRFFRPVDESGVEDATMDSAGFFESAAGIRLSREFQSLSQGHQDAVMKLIRALKDSESAN